RSAARSDDDLPRMAHQIGVRELHPSAVLAVVVQDVATELAVNLLADAIARRIAALEVEDRRLERCHAVRPDDAVRVVARLDHRADQPAHADTVAAHLRRDRLAVRSRDLEAHWRAVLRAEIEDVPDLDAASLAPPVGCHLRPGIRIVL